MHTPPLPLISGERVRNWNLLRQTARHGWRVSLFSLLHEETAPSADDRALLEDICTEVVLAPFRVSAFGRRARIARDFVLGRSFHASFFATPELTAQCKSWLERQNPDAVVIETHYMAPYVSARWLRRSLFDTHNCEARRVATMAESLGRSPRGIAARLQQKATVRFEETVTRQAARIAAVSEDERSYFEQLAPGRVDLVPNGVDCQILRMRAEQPATPGILFLGSLDYSPNVHALAQLIDDVAPRLSRRDATLTVVGSHPRPEVLQSAKRSPIPTTVAGYVADTQPYWDAARVLVVPLRIGGGTRLKVLEALARGVPVVSTSIGCEGLGLSPGKELLVADDPEEFARCVDSVLESDELCRSLAAAGRATAEARFDWSMIGDSFAASVAAAAALPD